MLIVFEGIDGAGKSGHSAALAENLRQQEKTVHLSFEPTDGPHGRRLRETARSGRLPVEEETALFLADRKEHVDKLIRPALERNEVVILDRYYFSNMAYQGARGADPQEIRRANETFAPPPDHLFLLDLPVETALDRIELRDGEPNYFEKKECLSTCREIFLSLADPFVHRIDSTQPLAAVRDEILAHFPPS